MAEFIDREAAIEACCGGCNPAMCSCDCDEVAAIRTIPAANVQPVRHGRWIETNQPMGWDDVTCAECSECGEDFVLDEWGMKDMENLMRYCPNCGAKMDGGDQK